MYYGTHTRTHRASGTGMGCHASTAPTGGIWAFPTNGVLSPADLHAVTRHDRPRLLNLMYVDSFISLQSPLYRIRAFSLDGKPSPRCARCNVALVFGRQPQHDPCARKPRARRQHDRSRGYNCRLLDYASGSTRVREGSSAVGGLGAKLGRSRRVPRARIEHMAF